MEIFSFKAISGALVYKLCQEIHLLGFRKTDIKVFSLFIVNNAWSWKAHVFLSLKESEKDFWILLFDMLYR